MLPAQFRLQEKKDFLRVYRQGKALNTPVLRIHTFSNRAQGTRCGIVISNKVIKRAVKRTRKKRQIRAAVADLINSIIPGYDIVVVGKAGIEQASFSQIHRELEEGLKKIGFLR